MGVFQSALKELRIPLDEIEEVHFKRRFFSGVLTIRARSMRALDAVPGVNDCELGLNCKRRHRNEAQQLATAVTVTARPTVAGLIHAQEMSRDEQTT